MARQLEDRGPDQAFLEAVARTMQMLDQHVSQYIARRLAENNIRTDAALQLSTREREVFGLILRGLTNKEIASQLNISEQTVKNHVHNIMRKLGARDRQAAVRRCEVLRLEAAGT